MYHWQISIVSFQEMELDDDIHTLRLQGWVRRHSSKVFCSHLGSLRTQASLDQSLRIETQHIAHIQDHRGTWQVISHTAMTADGGLVCFICTEIQVFQLPTYNGMPAANPTCKTTSFKFSESFAQDDATDVETRCELTKWLSLAMTKPDVLS